MAKGPHGASRKSHGQARGLTAVGRGWEQLGRADSGDRFFVEWRKDVETGYETSRGGSIRFWSRSYPRFPSPPQSAPRMGGD